VDRSGLALLAGDTLVASATSGVWGDARREIAALFGAGSPDWKTLRRLDATHAELVATAYSSHRRVRIKLASEWSVRFKDLIVEHPGIEVDVAAVVTEIRTKTDEPAARPAVSEHAKAVGRVRFMPKPDELDALSDESGQDGFDQVVRSILIGSAVIAALVALTHHILVWNIASITTVPWTHTLLTWPTASAQPILAGCSAFCLCAIAMCTYDWRKPTQRVIASVIASGAVAVISAGPMILVCTMAAFRLA
jgi:hypothetical protein